MVYYGSTMNKTLGAILLVSGTTIGAAMLALPVVTGLAGFLPTACLFVLFWAFMLFTAFLILEVNLWFPKASNMISMARATLGPAGEALAWVAYLYLLYALMTAYLAGSGPIVNDFIGQTGLVLPHWIGYAPLILLFLYFVFRGAHGVDAINRWLMAFLAGAFAIMVAMIAPEVRMENLAHRDFSALPLAVSVTATSFGFHIIIPSLTTYLGRDVRAIKRALVVGSLIPLAVYLIWEAVSLGVIPLESLKAGYREGANGAALLTEAIDRPWIEMVARAFAFFAIVTSFLGVSLSLADCLADGLHMRKWGHPSWLVDVLTIVPPLAIVAVNPRAFLTALEYAGTYGVIVLLCLMPAIMVWRGRYILNKKGDYAAPFGKIGLVLTAILSLAIIFLDAI